MLERIPPREWHDLAVAWFAISIAFTLLFITGGVTVTGFLFYFVIALSTVGIGFVAHEMAHKFTAMGYGYWAEFRKDNLMLLVAVVMAALVQVVFAAPGATMIYGSPTREQNGRISAAGPLVNLVLCFPFLVLTLATGGILALIGTVGWRVNAMLAAFNMLPVGGLDGRKVLSWNVAVFVVMIAVSFGLVAVSLEPGILGQLYNWGLGMVSRSFF